MTLSNRERKEFESKARPLMKWLNENTYPHCYITIDSTKAELTEGICSVVTNDYIVD